MIMSFTRNKALNQVDFEKSFKLRTQALLDAYLNS